MAKFKSLKFWDNREPVAPSLSRSQYSLVSCGEVTSEALKLWLELPEEVKQDHFWEPFRQQYEKQRGQQTPKNRTQRLPLVKSAPQINNGDAIKEEVSITASNGLPVSGNKQNGGKDIDSPKKSSKFSRARYLTKMTALLTGWIFFTVVFMLYDETEVKHRNSYVDSREVKTFIINTSTPFNTVLVSLSGPFLTEQTEKRLNSSQREKLSYIDVWIEKSRVQDGVVVGMQMSAPWKVYLRESNRDFSIGELRSSPLHLSGSTVLTKSTEYNLRNYTEKHISGIDPFIKIKTSLNESIPFTLSYRLNPLDQTTGVLYAVLLLIGLYALICFEIINRTLAAVLISTLSLAVLSMAGSRPTLAVLCSWLDLETLLLLFSMMVLVAIMAETGMFDYLAVYTFQITKGKMWPLITLLCAITALVSTVLDNVTTVLLMAPVTIRLCEVMGLDPVPILLSMVLYSNIGGTATPVGDPPNVIIASNKLVTQSGINFAEFTLHMTVGIFFVAVQTYLQLRFMFRDTSKLRLSVPRDIQELRHQIAIWRRATESLPHMSSDQNVVRERLERKIGKLNVQLEAMLRESGKRACPKETFHTTLAELKEKYKIRDKWLLIKATIAVAFVVSIFFLHALPEFNRVSLGWTALLGAMLLLILYDRDDLEPILHRVEWSTLLFFAALFVLMEALSQLGLIAYIGGATEALILQVDENARLAVAVTVILWVSGVTSAFVDNIPLTTMMIRVVTSLGTNPTLNMPMAPLIWALAFGACLGGNGTVIGASANVVCVGVAEQHGYKFTFMQFFRVGFPCMIGHLIVANAYLLLCHCALTWH